MHPTVPHPPRRPPGRGQPASDDAAARGVRSVGEEATDQPPDSFYGDLLPPEARPQTDWDWAPDNERRRR